MLPHQVRPILPRIRKLIEKNAPENDGIQDSFLIRGGPLVRAVYSDLQAICETHFLPHFVNNGTTKIENAFIMFKDIFNRCQMSLLHTKLIPERADRSQVSQETQGAVLVHLGLSYSYVRGCFICIYLYH